MPLRISCTIPIPPEHGTLVFLRHGIHPYLTAYEYKLKFAKGSTTVERSLPSNSKSLILVNTHWYPANQHGGPGFEYRIEKENTLSILNSRKFSESSGIRAVFSRANYPVARRA